MTSAPTPTPTEPASRLPPNEPDVARLMAATDKRRRKLSQWLASPASRQFPPCPRRVVRMANDARMTLPGRSHAEWRKQFDGAQVEIPAPAEVS